MERELLRSARIEAGQLPGSLELAYLGDTVYDLFVRSALVRQGGRVRNLHRAAVDKVCARAQSQALARIEPMLTPEEADVARRGRNVKQTPPRHADLMEYHRATALEALVGYLYLTGQLDRLCQLMEAALGQEEEEPCPK